MNPTQYGLLLIATVLLLFGGGWSLCAWIVRDMRRVAWSFASFCFLGWLALALLAFRGYSVSFLADAGAQLAGVLAALALWRAVNISNDRSQPDREQLFLLVGTTLIVVPLWFFPDQKPLRVLLVNGCFGWVCLRTVRDLRGALLSTVPVAFVRLIEVAAYALVALVAGRTLYTFLTEPAAINLDAQGAGAQWVVWLLAVSLTLVNVAFAYVVIKRLVDRLNELVVQDSLTGALNRRGLDEAMERAWAAFRRRPQAPLAMATFDVDNFKAINDNHGHAVGDQVLCQLVQVVRQEMRQSDILGRVGGEEFLLLLPHADRAGALFVGERLCAAAQQAVWPLQLKVTISVGVTVVEADDTSVQEIIARADQAMYLAKSEGKNRVQHLWREENHISLTGTDD